MQNIKRFDDKPYMTIGIIVVNIIVFVLMSLSGSTFDAQYMAAHGAMYPEYIKDGQYWRLLTSVFMHFGLMHILNNMVVLGCCRSDSREGYGACEASDYISCVRHVWKCIIVHCYAL